MKRYRAASALLALSILLLSAVALGQEPITIPAIFLYTDRQAYMTGWTVTIHGLVIDVDGLGAPSIRVEVSIIDPLGEEVYAKAVRTDEEGRFTLQWKIPDNAEEGTYLIYAIDEEALFDVAETTILVCNLCEPPQYAETLTITSTETQTATIYTATTTTLANGTITHTQTLTQTHIQTETTTLETTRTVFARTTTTQNVTTTQVSLKATVVTREFLLTVMTVVTVTAGPPLGIPPTILAIAAVAIMALYVTALYIIRKTRPR